MPKRFATTFDTVKGIGKGIFSFLAFPFCAVATGALYVAYQSAQSVNIIAAYFVGKDSWIGRTLKWDPNFDQAAKTLRELYELMMNLTLTIPKNLLGEYGNFSRSTISEHSTALTSLESRSGLTDKDKRGEYINREGNVGNATPSGSPEPKTCIKFITDTLGLTR